jgi:branched-chain amino acid transport system permease protein
MMSALKVRLGATGFDVTEAVALLVLLVLPLVVPGGSVSLGLVALQYTLFALGLNIVLGWTDLLDLGAAGFVAVGAYTTAILTTVFGWPALAALPGAAVVGCAAGVMLGIPTLRHRADYFAILTLGFAELVALTIRNWPSVTRGSLGYSGIPATTLPFLDVPLRAVPPIGFYYLALALVVPCYVSVRSLRTTRWGRSCHVAKHPGPVADCYGINLWAVKLVAFGLSATLLALGGFIWAVYQRAIVPTEFNVLLSCLVITLVVVGGIGNPRGAVLGAALVGTVLELLRRVLTEYGLPQNTRYFIFAVTLVVFIHWRPRGLIPDQPRWLSVAGLPACDVVAEPKTLPLPLTSPIRPLLRGEHLSKKFGGVIALNDVKLDIGPAECVALIGPNGSGKTTLLNLLGGLLRPDSGMLWLDGHRIDRLPAYRIARAGVGRSFQEIAVFDDVSVCDNVFLTAASDVSAAEVSLALTRFGLDTSDIPCASLSYGAKKALDLARLFVRPHQWRLVCLDEPTAGLNQREAAELVQVLAQLRAQVGLAMVIVSHDTLFLEALSVDRVVVLNEGRVFMEGPFEQVRADPDVRELFWGVGEGSHERT